MIAFHGSYFFNTLAKGVAKIFVDLRKPTPETKEEKKEETQQTIAEMLEKKLDQAGKETKKEKTPEDDFLERQKRQEKEILDEKRADAIDIVATCFESLSFMYYM